MIYSGFQIYSNPLALPDFFVIHDWNNPEKSAEPEWRNVLVIGEKMFAHPTLIEKIKTAIPEKL